MVRNLLDYLSRDVRQLLGNWTPASPPDCFSADE